jgi:thioesterase domain-containing protein
LEILQKNNELKNFELQLKDKDGSLLDFTVNARLEEDLNTHKRKIVGSLHSVTEQRKAQKKAEIISKQWEITFNSISDLVSIHTKDFTIVKVSTHFQGLQFLAGKGVFPDRSHRKEQYVYSRLSQHPQFRPMDSPAFPRSKSVHETKRKRCLPVFLS